VHFVSDVVLGMVLGGAFVGAFRWVEARMCGWPGGAVVPGLATGAEDEANARHGLGCLPGGRLEVGVALAGLAAAMVGLGWGVRAWVASVDLPGGWATHAAHARGGSVLALVGLCFFGWVGVRAVLGWGWLARWEVRVAPGHRLLRAAVAGVGAVGAHDAVSRLLSTS
jgi:hypothetical protein